MKKLTFGLTAMTIIAFGAIIAGCTAPATQSQDRDTMFQVSTFNALSRGIFDGSLPVSTLMQHGDLGIGTFEALDGEMITLDGTCYQASSDGKVYKVDDHLTTPFAIVTFMDADQTVPVSNVSGLADLSALFDRSLPGGNNTMYAVKLHGNFSHVKTRSVPAQSKPYPVLTEAVKNQTVFEKSNVSGTVVAVRFPEYMAGVNVAGYHYHFISDDRQFGGHLLDCNLIDGTAMIDQTDNFSMSLPDSGDFRSADIAKTNESDVKAIEK